VFSNEEIKALISAIGCGIGEDFDVAKARYHKIILMTDADVDGAHIRTLLLTFFFRHMKPLVETGFLYIAQPPLYKAKIGRKEQYLKDDTALKSFLFDWAKEQTILSMQGKELSPEAWQATLSTIMRYDDLVEKLGAQYRIPYEHCHRLVSCMIDTRWNLQDGTDDLIANLNAYFKSHTVSLRKHVRTQEDEATEAPLSSSVVVFSVLNKEWPVTLNFFSSVELKNAIQLLEELKNIHHIEWTMQIIGKDRTIEGNDILQLIHAIATISKPYLNIQRYKGLGEMNPEQLWETAMDSKSRSLLKVSIEDALEADNWFATLMGDDVAGRKSYIEEFGHFVKNLDV
jgi:DNA gyrase subunit B